MKFFKNLFKSRDDKIKEIVQSVTKGKPITTQDADLARLDKMSQMVQRMQGNQPSQNNPNQFFQQMIQFEQFKNGMVDMENNKLDQLREQIEQEGESGEDFKMSDVLGLIQGVQGENKPTNSTSNTSFPQTMKFPEPHQETREVPAGNMPPPQVRYTEPPLEIKPLVDLTPIEASFVDKAIKKIPKTAKMAFKALSEEKKDAVIQRMADGMEN